jgi:dTDP-4-dehydrorhamnose 3,5-epimerase
VIERLAISDVWLYTPRRFEDERGWFSETFSVSALASELSGVAFVQDNHAYSKHAHTLRGLHFQTPPKAQDKLLRVVRGAVLDVAVDIRRASPTFGRSVSATLSADNGCQIFVPKGFAHGYLTLAPDTEVLYKVSDFYSRDHEGGLAWDDSALGIDWGVAAEKVIVAERDRLLPRLDRLAAFF